MTTQQKLISQKLSLPWTWPGTGLELGEYLQNVSAAGVAPTFPKGSVEKAY